MRGIGRIVLTASVAVALLGAVASSAGAASLVGTWKTSCPSYYYNVLAAKGGCTAAAVPSASGLTQLPTTLRISATNKGQTQGTNAAAYCALPTACPGTASAAANPAARAAQSTSQCVVPAAMQALQTQDLGGGRFRAGLLAIGWLFNPSGLSGGACTVAPALASLQLAKNGTSFVASYTGYRRKSGGGYSFGPPFTFTVRYDRQSQASK